MQLFYRTDGAHARSMDGTEWVEMHTREQITDDKSKGDVDLWSQYFTYILCGEPEKVHMPDWDETVVDCWTEAAIDSCASKRSIRLMFWSLRIFR
jgi:hypothetical protein